VSPPEQKTADYFLHVLTATDSSSASVDKATAEVTAREIRVSVGETTIAFNMAKVGGSITLFGRRRQFTDQVASEPEISTLRPHLDNMSFSARNLP
jgi:hypothetical protein